MEESVLPFPLHNDGTGASDFLKLKNQITTAMIYILIIKYNVFIKSTNSKSIDK